MFSPKVVAAVVIIVIIIALVLINFEGIAEKAKLVFKGSGKSTNIFWSPGKSPSGELDMTIYPSGVFVLKPDAPLDVSIDSTAFSDFLGEIRVDYLNKTIKFVDSRTPLKVELQLSSVKLGDGLKLNKLSLDYTRMNVTKDGWSKSIQNGSVEVEGFVGRGMITTDYFQIEGNVTKFSEK